MLVYIYRVFLVLLYGCAILLLFYCCWWLCCPVNRVFSDKIGLSKWVCVCVCARIVSQANQNEIYICMWHHTGLINFQVKLDLIVFSAIVNIWKKKNETETTANNWKTNNFNLILLDENENTTILYYIRFGLCWIFF